jgi:hypothetical protein
MDILHIIIIPNLSLGSNCGLLCTDKKTLIISKNISDHWRRTKLHGAPDPITSTLRNACTSLRTGPATVHL